MSDPEFVGACLFRLGLPVRAKVPSYCTLCGSRDIDPHDHFLTCHEFRKHSQHGRHAAFRDAVENGSRLLGCSVIHEPQGYSSSSDRRVDCIVRRRHVRPDLFCDTTISHPLSASYVSITRRGQGSRRVTRLLKHREDEKRRKYAPDHLEQYGGKFVPLAMETYGRLGPSCISFIRELTSIENAPDLDNPLMDEMELNPSTPLWPSRDKWRTMHLYGSHNVYVTVEGWCSITTPTW